MLGIRRSRVINAGASSAAFSEGVRAVYCLSTNLKILLDEVAADGSSENFAIVSDQDSIGHYYRDEMA